jgi:hypothetical protein
MTFLVWRQYRLQWAIALALLAAFAAVMAATGLQMASAWHSVLAACGPGASHGSGDSCGGSPVTSPLGNDMRLLSLLVPAVLGFLWGAPLVALEMEAGTTTFAWTQGVTRTRWLSAKVGLLLLAAALCGGAVSLLVTWWSGPVNAQLGDALQLFPFDTAGIVPIGYAVFAMALGITTGALLRRTLPAIAITLGGFIGVRLLFDEVIRQRLLPAATTFSGLMSQWTPPGQAWVLGSGIANGAGQVVSGAGVSGIQATRGGPLADMWFNGVPVLDFPAACQKLLAAVSDKVPGPNSPADLNKAISCAGRYGFRDYTTYQPGYHYWPLQGIEAGLYLAMAAALLAVTFYAVRRRDAY